MIHATYHVPVLLKETINGLNLSAGKKYIDATVGGAGHSIEILRHGGWVLGIDADPDAIGETERRVKETITKEKLDVKSVFVQGNFNNLKSIAVQNGFNKVSGILFDLGISSHQLDQSGRGFSLRADELLDMRMDPKMDKNAADIINHYTAKELYDCFASYAEELHSRGIAEAIVRARTMKMPITRTTDLITIISQTLRKSYGNLYDREFDRKVHDTAARIFQAIRIVVNDELNNIKEALVQAMELLEPKGRLAVISFHSLEDRIVKRYFISMVDQNRAIFIEKNPIRASWTEQKQNSRSKSAKLRIIEKI